MPIEEEPCCLFIKVTLLYHHLRVSVIQGLQLRRFLQLRWAKEVLSRIADLIFDLAEYRIVDRLIQALFGLLLGRVNLLILPVVLIEYGNLLLVLLRLLRAPPLHLLRFKYNEKMMSTMLADSF